MSHKNHFTKDNIDEYLKELGKVFRKKNGTKTPAELIIVGGAAVLINYKFREGTEDIDAIIHASSVMKEAIFELAEKHEWTDDWLNDDFHFTGSYADKLVLYSQYYRTFSNILEVRTVSAEYLVAMKLMSGRDKKNDLSDIVGIIKESRENGKPISMDDVDRAVTTLYTKGWEQVPNNSKEFIKAVFASNDLDKFYKVTREQEIAVAEEFMNTMQPKATGLKDYIQAHEATDKATPQSPER